MWTSDFLGAFNHWKRLTISSLKNTHNICLEYGQSILITLYIAIYFWFLGHYIIIYNYYAFQREQEETAKQPMSDSNEEVDEKPKNQSIAQVIYAENRVSFVILKYFKDLVH